MWILLQLITYENHQLVAFNVCLYWIFILVLFGNTSFRVISRHISTDAVSLSDIQLALQKQSVQTNHKKKKQQMPDKRPCYFIRRMMYHWFHHQVDKLSTSFHLVHGVFGAVWLGIHSDNAKWMASANDGAINCVSIMEEMAQYKVKSSTSRKQNRRVDHQNILTK